MPQRTSPEKNLRRRRVWLGCLSLICVAAGCALEESGSQPSPPNTGSSSTTSSGDTSSSSSSGASSGSSSTSSSSSSSSASSSSSGQGGAGGNGGQGGSGGGTTMALPRTCMEILTADPSAPSGTYTLDPDGIDGNAPFSATCKMMGTKGWTLVGLEKPNATENLKFLGVESGTPGDLVAGKTAIIGVRFRGIYKAVRIEWDTVRYLEFNAGTNEIFDDTVNVSLPITGFKTSETTLDTWVNGSAKFCRATSQSANKVPGDSSWAVKPSSDNNMQCGCNSAGWTGRGAFYSGTKTGCNLCNCSTGGFAGVKDNGEPKSATVGWETRIYVL